MRSCRRLLMAFVGALSVVAPFTATEAALIVSAPEVVADPGTTGFFDILLTNPDATSITIGGFTIDLFVDPLEGIAFTGVATSPTSHAYLFAGTGIVDAIGAPFSFDTFPNTGFTASDIAFVVLGEVLNPGETVSLGRVAFEVPDGMQPGRMIPINFGSFTAVADEQGLPVDFTTDEGSIRIGGASAPVPEPSSLTVMAILAAVTAGHYWRRRKNA